MTHPLTMAGLDPATQQARGSAPEKNFVRVAAWMAGSEAGHAC
jgi:hypothetical protein